MIKFLRNIGQDIRRGENIDVYLTIVIALTSILLSMVGFTDPGWIAGLTLAVLAILAVSLLGNRHRLEVIEHKLTEEVGGVFLQDFPDIRADLERASDVWLIGVTLNRTVRNYHALLEAKLRRGDTLSVLLTEPEGASVDLVARQGDASTSPDHIRSLIHMTLGRLCRLQDTAPDHLEIRVFDHPFICGGYAFNPDKPDGIIYVEYYSFREAASLPKLILRQGDGFWYEFYKSQLKALWESGVPWCRVEE